MLGAIKSAWLRMATRWHFRRDGGEIFRNLLSSGYFKRQKLPAEVAIAGIAPEHLDHLFHALQLSGQLAELTDSQVDAILHALQTAGRLDSHI